LFFLAFLVGTSCEAQALGRNTPSEFDYYALVLGWAPSYCLTEGPLRRELGKAARLRAARAMAAMREGLARGLLYRQTAMGATSVIDEMRDIMPSKGVIIHEYRTHGTCSGLDPVQYFGVVRELYERVKVPESLAASGA